MEYFAFQGIIGIIITPFWWAHEKDLNEYYKNLQLQLTTYNLELTRNFF